MNCVDCQDSDTEIHCNECLPGYIFSLGSDICLNFCATGFKEVAGETTCEESAQVDYDGLVASFTFTGANSANLYWTYLASADSYTSGSHSWTIKLYGGNSELKIDTTDDPFATDDRGLYFDGVRNYMTSQMLVLHSTFAMNVWVKPFGSGTIFSSSQIATDLIDKTIQWGINDNRMEFEDREHHFYFQTDK